MTVHSVHPDTHTHGLADGCERCAEHAAQPVLSLDKRNLLSLQERVLKGWPARSQAERQAMDEIRGHLGRQRMLQVFACDPDESCGYDDADPKHPGFHSVHADLYDMREGK